ncbi:unnamed protein product [Rhizoctonia solani]|uniref:Uncharacterized protein n=1 Tax=Rhizoctonia solani TaxID=456999 RepID=A0A8H3BLR5_9AGAM|nr:unnamed protein product [Rhizoctonia solani]
MFKFAVASLLAVASLVVAQNDPSINSPASVVQCQPVQLSWTATKEPVYIAIIPGGQPGATPIEDFGVQAPGTKTMTWKCNRKAGTSITFQIRDSDGAVAYSGNVNVQDSSDSSCVKDTPAPPPPSSAAAPSASSATPPSGGASSAPAPAPAPGTTAAAPPANTTRAADSSVSSRAPAAATSATPSSTAVAANAALHGAQIGWTGLMGVLAAYIIV